MSAYTAATGAEERATQVREHLDALRGRLDQACRAVGRDPSTVTTVVVTKQWPAADVVTLLDAGVRDLGEARADEAAAKRAEIAGHRAAGEVVWHHVGQVQSRQARVVATHADVVHSVDRSKLVRALDRAADPARPLAALVQVDLDERPDPGRGGAAPADLGALCDEVAAADGLRLAGLMCVAPRDVDPAPVFDRLAGLAARVRTAHPGAVWLSAGMSGDLEAAVAAGATHVRVGTAVLGHRPHPA